MKTGHVLLVSEREIAEILEIPKVIDLVEESLKDYAMGLTINPIKLHLPLYPQIEGYMNSMPTYMKKQGVTGAKLVTVYKNNTKKFNLPVTMGTIVMQDPNTGAPIALMGGTNITALRTGAAAGVAAKYFNKKNSKVLVLIGAGAQGYTSFLSIAHVTPGLETLKIIDINTETLDRFIEKVKVVYPNLRIETPTDIQEACQGADIVCACTTSPKPLLRYIKFDKGTHVVLVAEAVDDRFLGSFDKCFLDFPECYAERLNNDVYRLIKEGDKDMLPIKASTADSTIGHVIAGLHSGRENDDEIIVSGGVGMGCEDLMVAKYVYDQALERNMGYQYELFDPNLF